MNVALNYYRGLTNILTFLYEFASVDRFNLKKYVTEVVSSTDCVVGKHIPPLQNPHARFKWQL